MKKIRKSAFSLIELSVVLVIIAIVITGVLSASTVSINNAKTKITKERMQAIYKALGNFMLTNYRLPCPAALSLARDTASYGVSVGAAGACAGSGVYQSATQNTIIYGMVPFATLGLPADMGEDGFGSKLIYIVNKDFTAADYPSTTLNSLFSSHLENDVTVIKVLQVASGNIVDGNAFVLLSHGQNRYGAFKSSSTVQSNSVSTDTYEQQHYPSGINTATNPYTANFGIVTGHALRVTITAANPSSEMFDDTVFFKTRSQMVLDFNAMSLIPCAGSGGYSTVYYGQTSYRNTNCTTPNDVTPSKKCAAYGAWTDEQGCFVS